MLYPLSYARLFICECALYPLFLLCPNGLKPLYNKRKGRSITQLALGFQESLDAAVSLIWALFDMVILIVLIYAFRY